MFTKERRGTNMLELIGVMVVIGILLGVAGFSVAKQTKRANRESTANALQMYATAMSEAYYDLGSYKFEDGGTVDLDAFRTWLDIVQNEYMSVVFDTDNIVLEGSSVKVPVSTPLDSWGESYVFWFSANSSQMPRIILASGGPDGAFASWCAVGAAAPSYGDDVIVVVHPKT